jgi:hypothetical protein
LTAQAPTGIFFAKLPSQGKMRMTTTDESIETVRVVVLPDGRLAGKAAATYVGVTEKTMAMWRCANRGPRFVKVGGKIFYFRNDLDAFIRGEVTA